MLLTLLQRYSDTFDCTASWNAHSGIVLSSIITQNANAGEFELITGGNDGAINVIPLYNFHHPILSRLHIQVWNIHPAGADTSNDDLHEIIDEEGRNACNGLSRCFVLIYGLLMEKRRHPSLCAIKIRFYPKRLQFPRSR